MLGPRGTMLNPQSPQRANNPKTQNQLENQSERGKIRKKNATTKKKQPNQDDTTDFQHVQSHFSQQMTQFRSQRKTQFRGNSNHKSKQK
jgi:hypothetical protein